MTNWLKELKLYASPSILDDIIFEDYKNKFYQSFVDCEIIDENSEYEPFNLEQQLFLDEYLQKALIAVEDCKDEIEKEDAENLKSAILYTKKNLTKDSKAQVMKNISTV